MTPKPTAVASSSLLAQVWRQRLIFGLVFLPVTTFIVIGLLIAPKYYFASGAVIVSAPEPLSGSSSSFASPTWQQRIGDPADLESNILKIASPRLLRIVLETSTASSAIERECYAQRNGYPSRFIGIFRSYFPALMMTMLPQRSCSDISSNDDLKLDWATTRYSVASIGRSRVISVGYTSPLVDVAQTMASLLINVYLEDEKAMRLEPREAGVIWSQRENARLGDALRHDETAIETFRESHGLLQGQHAAITSERLTETTRLLAGAEVDQARASAQLDELNRGGGADSAIILNSRTIINLKEQEAIIAAQLASLSSKYKSGSPVLAPLVRQRDETRRRINMEIDKTRSSIRGTYEASTAQVAILTKALETFKREAGEASNYETQIASMIRDAEIKRTMYMELSKSANQLQTEREVLTASSQLVNLPELPTKAYFPKPIPFLVGGTMLAGFLGVVAALHRDRTDHRLRLPALLQTLTHMPVLSSVPVADETGPSTLSDLMAQLRQPSMLQEAVRRLNAQISLTDFGRASRTLLVTSSEAREGKSFVALGLAQFGAASGKRVLVIECDLRRPSMANAMKADDTNLSGLTAFLSGKVGHVPVVHLPHHVGFDIVFAGEPNIASTEMLAGQRFMDVLQMAKAYDLVLIDSPPCGLLMDAGVIAPRVDGVLFCARWGRATPDVVNANLKNLQNAGASIVGLVMTFTPPPSQWLYGSARIYGQSRLISYDAQFR